MNKLNKILTSLTLFSALSYYSTSCTASKANIGDEKVARKEVNLGDWKDLVKKAELEADTLFMRDKDIINIVVKYNIFHHYMKPLAIPGQDTIPEGERIYLFLHGHSSLGTQNGPILLNNYVDENRAFPQRRLTTIHEFLHFFYYSKGILNLSEKEIDARAWFWYKRKYIDEVRKDAENDTKKHK